MKFFDDENTFLWVMGGVFALFILFITIFLIIQGFNTRRREERTAEEEIIAHFNSHTSNGKRTNNISKYNLLRLIQKQTHWSFRKSEKYVRICLIPRNVMREEKDGTFTYLQTKQSD